MLILAPAVTATFGEAPLETYSLVRSFTDLELMTTVEAHGNDRFVRTEFREGIPRVTVASGLSRSSRKSLAYALQELAQKLLEQP
jgi:hypothetical protein